MRVILLPMSGSRSAAFRVNLRPRVYGWLCGSLVGMVACEADDEVPREEAPSEETSPAESRGDEMLPPASQQDPALVVSSLADSFASLREDVLAQPQEAWPYLRYVLGSRDATAPESEQERLALLQLVNSVSLSPQISAPVPLAELVAYRLDLRDYLWDRPVDVSGVKFSDGWEAIVARSGLALPALPDEPLAALTGTTTAALPARGFLTAASSGSVYYALTSAPGFETELQERLAARFPDPETEPVYNPGFGAETRHGYQGARRLLLPDGSAYWQGLPNTPRGNSLFNDPLDFNSWETDAIYPLPNGLPAFFLDTPYTETIPAPLTRLGSGANGAPDELVADCIACHSTGPLPTEDVLRDYLRDNGALIGYPPNIPWPTQEELDAVIAADSGAYERVFERAGLSIEFAGALQMITRRYAAGLNLADMAAALRASETQVRAALPAGTTTLAAKTFLSQFRALLCRIHPDADAASDYCY
jgi:hypothetical protein